MKDNLKVSSSSTQSPAIVDELLDLHRNLLVPFMQVRRDMPFPGENGRNETDSEHVFSLAMIAITVIERLGLKLDYGLVAKYCLIHDLVEAYAGDVSVRDHAAYVQKAIDEHEALQKIKTKFRLNAPWIAKYIEKYESKTDEESKFVYALDKCMGAITRLSDGGKYWSQYYPEPDGKRYHEVVKRLRAKAETYPPLLELFDTIHDELDKRWPEYLKRYPPA